MMTASELLMQELRALPPDKVQEVLDFVRFLKLQSRTDAQVSSAFHDAVARARRIAEENGITEQDIAGEIRQARTE